MKSLIFLAASVCCFSLSANSQSLDVKFTGKEWERVIQLADDFGDSLVSEVNAIRFIYATREKGRNKYFFGLLHFKGQFENLLPSYYFFTPRGNLVLVYVGTENNVKFSEAYRNTLISLLNKYMAEEIVATVHYYIWSVEFKDGNEVFFTNRLPKKKHAVIPKWISLGR